MSSRDITARCPGCQSEVHFEVVVPDPLPQRIQLIEDTERISAVASERDAFKRQAEDTNRELQHWQSGESHLTASDMLNMLQTCPNCRPTLDSFVAGVQNKTISDLTTDEVKALAKQHKFWPPPPIEIKL